MDKRKSSNGSILQVFLNLVWHWYKVGPFSSVSLPLYSCIHVTDTQQTFLCYVKMLVEVATCVPVNSTHYLLLCLLVTFVCLINFPVLFVLLLCLQRPLTIKLLRKNFATAPK